MIYLLEMLLRPGVTLLFTRRDSCFPLAAIQLPNGRRLILLERTYRAPADVDVIVDPTDEELEQARTDRPSALYGSERAVHWSEVDFETMLS